MKQDYKNDLKYIITVESNVQTLCWRCNREKSDSI
ncbi:hypothetical protein HCG64_10125 [Coprobacillus sp. K06]|nr:hypothetical protein [Coprobacillus sp. K06]